MRSVVAVVIVACVMEGSLATAASDLPPVGRSLFDHLTIHAVDGRNVQLVPYPFESLLDALEKHAGVDALGRAGVAAVLIPIGRSLQRNASPGRQFEHPRVVVAVTGDSTRLNAALPALKDKLFLGFQAETGVIEVISYNEAAGRFEFQVVQDYRSGARPRVRYARRTLCTTCHQNAGPIFSRPSWDETNANPAVARALSERASAFHGVRVARGIDEPDAIDNAVAAANRVGLVQAVWVDACARSSALDDPVGCRAAALRSALKLRLTRAATVDTSTRAQRDRSKIAAAWNAQWPGGLDEPDPSIPNRDPFFGASQRLQGPGSSARPWDADEVRPAVDPLVARPPVAHWRADPAGIEYYVRALAAQFAATDIARLERALESASARSGGARAATEAVDFAPLDRALSAIATATRSGRSDVLAAKPFRRAATVRALFAHLGVDGDGRGGACCDQTGLVPAPVAAVDEERERMAGAVPAQGLAVFYRNCGACHDSPDASPPGFLYGDAAGVQRKLARCGQRIQYRLQMWRVPPTARGKVPMPPPMFVPAWERRPPLDELDSMQAYLQRLPGAAALPADARAYESLPPCRESERGGPGGRAESRTPARSSAAYTTVSGATR